MTIEIDLTSFGLGSLFIALIGAYIIKNPLLLFKVSEIGSKISYRFRLSKHRRVIAKRLDFMLNSAALTFQNEMPAIFDKSIRLRWIENTESFADVGEGDIVLYMKDSRDANEVYANAVMLYVRNSLILDSRPFVERELLGAVDVSLAQRVLLNDSVAHECLQRQYLDPLLANERRRRRYELASSLEEHGVLTRIVLSEFSSLGLKLKGKRSTASTRQETVNFASFVERIVTRDSDDVTLRFRGKLFSSTIALVANTDTHRAMGIKFYQRKFRNDIDTGIRVIHLLGRGNRNLNLVRSLARWASGTGLVSNFVPRFFAEATPAGRQVRSVCISCYSAKLPTVLQLNPVEELHGALFEVLPDTITGELEILEIAREPNVRSKIIVRSLDGTNPISRCTGTDNENIAKIKSRLNAEYELIDFIVWNADPLELVKRAMYPLRDDEIFEIEFDSDVAKARIALWSSEYVGNIIGKAGINVRLAEKVTGYKIEIVEKEELLSAEDVAIRVLKSFVKPISDGSVVVKRLVRLSKVIKVLVDSNYDDMPSVACRRQADFLKIKNQLSGEYIYFIYWVEPVEDRIYNALAPLNKTEIVSSQVNETKKKATIFVLTVQARGDAVGHKGENVRAASQLTGYDITIKVSD